MLQLKLTLFSNYHTPKQCICGYKVIYKLLGVVKCQNLKR